VRFGCPEAAIVIPAKWLAAESPFAHRDVHRGALAELDESARRLRGDRLLVARVEKLLAERGQALGIERAARLLGVSNRTLTRRLAALGTSFHALVDESRKSRAAALLQDPALSATDVAYALGYEDAANFGRAFRRWYGMSPGRYRRFLEPVEEQEDGAE
jgi:AraC-like DNA-binding protein